MNVLVIEDEPQVVDFLQRVLLESGYAVEVADTAGQGLKSWTAKTPDLVLLDVMLPDGSGIDLLKEARRREMGEPVLVLTARGGLNDRVAGLDAGADDYLAKPFSVEELLARVRALLRRKSSGGGPVRCADLEIEPIGRRVTRGGRMVFLSSTEFSLLELLARKQGHPVSKGEILRHVWDDDERDGNVVEVYVNYLRHKLERGGASRLIHTVRGQGYMLSANGDPA